jgi:glucoamylase
VTKRASAVLAFVFCILLTQAHASTLNSWLAQESVRATELLLKNISPAGTARGAVVASPSRNSPDYFWHWIRDAGLVMNTVVSMHEKETDRAQRRAILSMLQDYADFSRKNQLTANKSGSPNDRGLGEPKFHVDGRAFDGDWGRPQNDGPALRAIALIRYAELLLTQGEEARVRSKLYDSKIPTHTVIKADLEFVAHHWSEASFDLWEEVRGQHFYTRIVQRRALVEGASLAQRMGDSGAAAFYLREAQKLELALNSHWKTVGASGFLTATQDSISDRTSNLDIAIILGVLHALGSDGFMSVTDDRVLATAQRLENEFRPLYSINAQIYDHQGVRMGPAIGRYPEDQYNGGYGPSGGNPWVLTTAAMAELCHRVADTLETQGSVNLNARNQAFFQSAIPYLRLTSRTTYRAGEQNFKDLLKALRMRGDQYFARVRYHANPDGSLSEQMFRDTGIMHGASDLTWSYASFLTAFWAR